MRARWFERTTRIERPLEEVFPFFSDAANLERLTPPSLRFEILTPGPIRMEAGTVIDYRLRLAGVPLRWRSIITEWEPPHRFVDVQEKGPYREWVHEHRFAAEGDSTKMTDRVRYALPFGPLGALGLPVVRRNLRRIFDFRARAIGEIFPPRGGATG